MPDKNNQEQPSQFEIDAFNYASECLSGAPPVPSVETLQLNDTIFRDQYGLLLAVLSEEVCETLRSGKEVSLPELRAEVIEYHRIRHTRHPMHPSFMVSVFSAALMVFFTLYLGKLAALERDDSLRKAFTG